MDCFATILLIVLISLPILGVLAINVEVGHKGWLTVLLIAESTIFVIGLLVGHLMTKVDMYEKKCETKTKVEF